MSAELTARLRAPNGHAIPVPPRRVTVGESAGCDIPISRGYGLAAVHFRLQPWEQGHFIEDAGSGLGLLINGASMTWAPLKHGDRITAGELSFVYECSDAPVPEFPASLEAQAATVPSEPAAESPPAWLPPEALLPPSPPPRWGGNSAPPPRGRSVWLPVLLLLLLAGAGVAVWFLFFPSEAQKVLFSLIRPACKQRKTSGGYNARRNKLTINANQ